MSTPQDSTKPVTLTTSSPAVVGGKELSVRLSEEVSGFIGGMSPAGATEYDTGSVAVPLASGDSGSGQGSARRIGRQVDVRVRTNRTWVANTTTTVATIPASPSGLRPPATRPALVMFDTGEIGWGLVNTDGTVTVRRTAAGAVAATISCDWITT